MAVNNEDKQKNANNEQQVADVAQNTDNAVSVQPNAGTSNDATNNNSNANSAGGSVTTNASVGTAKYTAPRFEFDTSDLAKQKLERVTIPYDIAKQRADAQQAQIDYYEQKRKSHMRDAEQDAKTAKRLKRGKLIGSIVDASRALANLWGTTNYAPNAYTGKDSMADAYQKKYDEWSAKVKADKDAYDAAYSQLVAAKADNADENYKDWRELQKTNVEIDKHNSGIDSKEMEYKFNVAKQNNDREKFNASQALKEKQFNESQALKEKQFKESQALKKQQGSGSSSGGGGRRGGSGGGGRSSSGSKITFTSKSGKRFTISGVNEATVRTIFETLPQNVKKQYRRFGFGEPSKIEMIQAIESQLDDNKILRGYIKRYM